MLSSTSHKDKCSNPQIQKHQPSINMGLYHLYVNFNRDSEPLRRFHYLTAVIDLDGGGYNSSDAIFISANNIAFYFFYTLIQGNINSYVGSWYQAL